MLNEFIKSTPLRQRELYLNALNKIAELEKPVVKKVVKKKPAKKSKK
ncbi:hypothetical protein OAF54_00855 [bacterium]|nr:hypothetical protein [bacterium]